MPDPTSSPYGGQPARETYARDTAVPGKGFRIGEYAIEKALGHGSMQVTSRYAHIADETRKHASEVMARVVEQAVQGGTQVAEVPTA